jgi:hypothetical protein
VSLPRLRPLRLVVNTSFIPSFSCFDPEGPQESSTKERHAQDWHTQSAFYTELGARDWNSLELGEPIVIVRTHIKMALHRTVPEGSCTGPCPKAEGRGSAFM